MSALHDSTAQTRTGATRSPRVRTSSRPDGLGLVWRRPRRQLGNTAFVLMLGLLLVGGLVAVLLLNTSLQNQAFRASELKREAAEMSYAEGELRDRVTVAASTRSLTQKASELGMVPNNFASFVTLPEGKITGEAKPANPGFIPSAITRSPEEQAKIAADEAHSRAQSRIDTEQRNVDDTRRQLLEARTKAAQQQQQQQGQSQQGQQGQNNQAQNNPGQNNQAQQNRGQNNQNNQNQQNQNNQQGRR